MNYEVDNFNCEHFCKTKLDPLIHNLGIILEELEELQDTILLLEMKYGII